MNILNETLRNDAIKLGLCQQWQNEWMSNKNMGQLIKMYKRGIDFCIEHKWPSCDWIVENFDRAELRDNKVFIREINFLTIIPSGIAVVRESKAKLVTERNAVVTLHCQDCQDIIIKAGKGSIVFVHLHNSNVKFDISELHSRIKPYIHDEFSTFSQINR